MSDPSSRSEHDVKVARLTAWLGEQGRAAVLIGTRHNFAWLSCGGRNGVDLGREPGAGWLLVCRDGRRFLIASRIERDRLADEEVGALGFEPVSYAWQEDRGDPALALASARRVAGDARIAADLPIGDAPVVEGALAALRASLTPQEQARYRALGADAGEVVGAFCRTLEPGVSERQIAARVAAALGERRIVTPVLLVAADDRIRRYRHPVPTDLRWQRRVMVVVCAERDGLVASLSRLVNLGPVDDDTRARTASAAGVFFRLAEATRPGTTGRELYDVAAAAYADAGFPGEEDRHHQGGACGYRTRDWVAHPGSAEVVRPFQAFAWNPSITGTKVEDTFLLTDGGPEVITASPGWPSSTARPGGPTISAPSILER
jgi:antitoxin VapB